MTEITTIQRFMIADYLNVGTQETPQWAFCGAGFNSLDENPSAQMDTKIYINNKASTSTIKSYQTQFPFDTDLIKDEDAVMEIYKIGRDQHTGAEAEREYVRVELFQGDEATPGVYPARKFLVSIEVAGNAGAGGETIHVTGNLNTVGNFVDGTFNTTTKTFTENVEVGG